MVKRLMLPLLWFSCGLFAAVAAAKDHVLLIGGGPEPWSSQISIEENVHYFGRTQQVRGIDPAGNRILFASGSSGRADVCFNHGVPVSPAREILASSNNAGRYLKLDYRPHQVPGVSHAASRQAILQALSDLARELSETDRLLIYFTGHGGKGANSETANLQTWGKEKLDVRTFAKALDAFRPETAVMVVMVQCYSGAFANLIFVAGDPANELAPHRRAGYFSTLATRTAAGCTPEVHRADYEDYSTYFLGALGGQNRLGEPVPAIDVDGDGAISLDEAHLHVVAVSPTIDIPLKTSDRFLRQFATIPVEQEPKITWDSGYSRLLGAAAPLERTALEALSVRLELDGEDRVAEAHRLSEKVDQEREVAQRKIRRQDEELKRLARKLAESLQTNWPVLRNAWHPMTGLYLADEAEEIDQMLRRQPSFAQWQRLRTSVAEERQKDLAAEKRWALLKRMVQTAESVALAENLRISNDPKLYLDYERLRTLERWPWAPILSALQRDQASE